MIWKHPEFDPVLFHVWGPLQITWYSLLYVGGFLLGRSILKILARDKRFKFTAEQMDEFGMWLLIGAVVGARIVYCVVYDFDAFLRNPLWLFQTYKGGLSFHGGLLGTVVAGIIFSRKHKIPFWNLADAMALATPTGLGMGRMGNFINGELYGRLTNGTWGMIFKNGGPDPRHPSQLYELFLEGIVLFTVLWFLRTRLKRDGQVALAFLFGYTLCRFIVEFFREPDAHLGYLTFGLSMGQILSVVQALAAVALFWFFYRKKAVPEVPKKKKAKSK